MTINVKCQLHGLMASWMSFFFFFFFFVFTSFFIAMATSPIQPLKIHIFGRELLKEHFSFLQNFCQNSSNETERRLTFTFPIISL